MRSWLQELAASQEPDVGLLSRRAKEKQATLTGITDMLEVIAGKERSLDSTDDRQDAPDAVLRNSSPQSHRVLSEGRIVEPRDVEL